ncbi:polyadenylate-binding protein-interacting protein 11 [Zea mays]|uniref:polyadenylate-binding protein-interacting protein 11 n=1 Tax=Zea mays TaxID=4577 RepID=UPI0009AA2E36|nr:polyadenylate-binding protein-interacting protein 11-like [Zea mays]|eukprot:XP_020397843.1 polyadenylate-binding protein-interacting protein 11-like [Zea mays]
MPPLRLWPLLLPPKLQLCNSSAEFTLSEFTANLSNHAIYSTANKGTVEHDIKNYLQPKFGSVEYGFRRSWLLTKYYYSIVLPLTHKVFDILLCPVDVAYKAADKIIQVTEENLATLFINCGHVVDCRMCGDPNSVLRFAFIEFTDDEGARAALNLSGNVLGYYPVNVLPSKTAIAPVNETFLPRPDDEREMCARTIYCTNIDKKVAQADLKLFFESICGEVFRLRFLGDYHHSTRIAFVEFVMAESATAALNSSGVVLGSLPISVTPRQPPIRSSSEAVVAVEECARSIHSALFLPSEI